MSAMQLIGPIVRLQVQASSLKMGERLRRWYDPAPIRAVPRLRVDMDGVIGVAADGATILDVHNRTHPATKNREENDLSFGFTGHYAAMRARFGDHLVDGIAGENILVAADRIFTEAEFAAGVGIEAVDGGLVRLAQVIDAEPCVEFSRFSLGYDRDAPADSTVTTALTFLRRGTRGFYATYDGEPTTIAVGAGVFLLSR